MPITLYDMVFDRYREGLELRHDGEALLKAVTSGLLLFDLSRRRGLIRETVKDEAPRDEILRVLGVRRIMSKKEIIRLIRNHLRSCNGANWSRALEIEKQEVRLRSGDIIQEGGAEYPGFKPRTKDEVVTQIAIARLRTFLGQVIHFCEAPVKENH